MRKRFILPIVMITSLTMSLAGCGQSSSDSSDNVAESTTLTETTEYQGSDLSKSTYDDIIAEYSNVILSASNGASLEDLYPENPDVAFDSFEYYQNDDGTLQVEFYYARTDINQDGSDELVIGIHYPEAETPDEVSIAGLFAQDGDGIAHCLLTGSGLDACSAFAYEVLVDIYPNNRFTIDEEPYDDGFYIFNIGEDGYTAKLEAHYDYKYGDDDSVSYVDSDGNELTGDEMQEMLGTSDQNLEWIHID